MTDHTTPIKLNGRTLVRGNVCLATAADRAAMVSARRLAMAEFHTCPLVSVGGLYDRVFSNDRANALLHNVPHHLVFAEDLEPPTVPYVFGHEWTRAVSLNKQACGRGLIRQAEHYAWIVSDASVADRAWLVNDDWDMPQGPSTQCAVGATL